MHKAAAPRAVAREVALAGAGGGASMGVGSPAAPGKAFAPQQMTQQNRDQLMVQEQVLTQTRDQLKVQDRALTQTQTREQLNAQEQAMTQLREQLK